ncbi:MAG: transposase [Nitrospira sp.]|nr:transposase [Nitrospira sp.]
MTRKAYDSDLTDEQWYLLQPFLEKRHAQGWGRPRTVATREVVNAVCYLNKTGCQWRSLPHDFPAWPVVYYYFSNVAKIRCLGRSQSCSRPAVPGHGGPHPPPECGLYR